jgi:hypothetical protein
MEPESSLRVHKSPVLDLTLSQMIMSMPPHALSRTSCSVLFIYSSVCLPIVYPFPQNPVRILLTMRTTCPEHLSLLILSFELYFSEENKPWSSCRKTLKNLEAWANVMFDVKGFILLSNGVYSRLEPLLSWGNQRAGEIIATWTVAAQVTSAYMHVADR